MTFLNKKKKLNQKVNAAVSIDYNMKMKVQ